MAYFNIRVELHYANSGDYKRLSTGMNQLRMHDVVQSGKGLAYRLPPGEYSYEGYATKQQVIDMVKVAARATGKAFAVRVTEGVSTWVGLEPVTSDATYLAASVGRY